MTTFQRTRSRHAALCAATIAALVLPACGTPGEPSPTTSPTAGSATPAVEPPNESDVAASAALATYTNFWEVTDSALANPGARDWRPELEAVAHGDALESVLAEVENYLSLPARTVGTITRSPSVTDVDEREVSILDCVDLGDSRLLSDRTGEILDDLENRVQRFHLRARVVAVEDNRWLVDETAPALDEPC